MKSTKSTKAGKGLPPSAGPICKGKPAKKDRKAK